MLMLDSRAFDFLHDRALLLELFLTVVPLLAAALGSLWLFNSHRHKWHARSFETLINYSLTSLNSNDEPSIPSHAQKANKNPGREPAVEAQETGAWQLLLRTLAEREMEVCLNSYFAMHNPTSPT